MMVGVVVFFGLGGIRSRLLLLLCESLVGEQMVWCIVQMYYLDMNHLLCNIFCAEIVLRLCCFLWLFLVVGYNMLELRE